MNTPTLPRLTVDQAEIERAVRLLSSPGAVIEVRALDATSANWRNSPHTISGYFDDPAVLASTVASYITKAKGIYITLNPINPALLARAANRLKDLGKGDATTADGDVLRRHWLPIDLDPQRPAEIGSSDTEHQQALAIARRISRDLQAEGWPAPILADSGNGGHLEWRIDVPVDDEGLIMQCLQALAARYDDALVKIDQKVFNPARIWKLYGTWAAKGDSTADRPHRQAKLLEVPEIVQVAPSELLRTLAATRPQEPAPARRTTDCVRNHPAGDFDLDKWISTYLPDAEGPRDWSSQAGKGRKWLLDPCPWNSSHTGGCAWIAERGNGAITAGCQHNSCQGNDWESLRRMQEPGYGARADRRNGQGAFTGPGSRTTAANTPRKLDAGYRGPATWATASQTETVEITGPAGAEPDGRTYMAIAGSTTAVPLDELSLPACTSPAPAETRAKPTTRPAEEIISQLQALQSEAGGKPARAAAEQLALDLVGECAGLGRADLARIASTLRSLGLPQEFCREWRGAVVEAKRHANGNGGDAPEAVPYEADEGHIYRVSILQTEAGPQLTRTVVADFTAQIAEEVTGEDEHRYYLVAGSTADGQSFEVEISAEKFADDGALLAILDEAAGAYAPVRAKMGAHLRPAIKLLTRQMGQTRQTRRYDRTGWAAGHFLIPGREPPNTSICLPQKLAYASNAAADLAQGLLALDHLVQALDRTSTTVAITSLFQAPLAQPAGWVSERFNTFIAGRTGSLKTSHTQCGMCLYGDFLDDSRLLKWGEGATRNAIMHYATRSHDLPLLLDNFKPNVGDGSKGFTALVHNLTEGTDKDRLQRAKNELRDTGQIRCWPIFTGEDVPADDPATIARLLVIRYQWDAAGDNEHLTAAQVLAQHLPAVGTAWLSWLESPEGQRIAAAAGRQLVKVRATWLAGLKTEEKDAVNAARIASNLAINQLTFWVLQQHPAIGPLLSRYAADHQAGLEAIAGDMARRSRVARAAVRLLRTLSELLATGKCSLEEKGQPLSSTLPERRIGWKDAKDGTYYLLSDVCKREVLKVLGADGLGYLSDNALHAQLKDMDLIASSDQGRHLKKVRVVPGERAQWVLHLKAEAIGADLSDEDESGGAAPDPEAGDAD